MEMGFVIIIIIIIIIIHAGQLLDIKVNTNTQFVHKAGYTSI